MARRNRRTPSASPAPLSGMTQRVEAAADGTQMQVREIPGGRATKEYRCPGCDQLISVGVAHIVAWPEEAFGGADERRHWHRSCWAARSRRGITRKRP